MYKLFYSWQSDLNVIDNKNYIESCLRKALLKLKNSNEFSIELNIDRATDKKIGTIDISDSIFKKIGIANIFIADVSIINPQTRKYRKVPNPNVLIELGYAARTIGWENIICIFNTKYGSPEILPFDIRNRRVLLYNSDNNKSILVESLFHAIKNTHNLNVPSNIIRDHYNAIIYTSLLQIISDFGKLIFGYDYFVTSPNKLNEVINIGKDELSEKLKQNQYLGFQLFKDYSIIIEELTKQLEKILVLKQYDDSYYVPLIKITDILRLYDKELNRRGDIDKLDYISKTDKYSLIKSNEFSLPNRYLLLKNIKEQYNLGMVCDFGDFKRKDHCDSLLSYFKLIPISLRFYSSFIYDVLIHINKWIDNNGGEFILDETRLEYYRSNNSNK